MKLTPQRTRRASWRPYAGAGLVVAAVALILFGERWLRLVLLALSQAKWAQAAANQFRPAWQVASRFVAGESVDSAMAAARQVNAQGMSATLNFLGEHVANAQEAVNARDQILLLLDKIHESGVDANVSIKPSQLGLRLEPGVLRDNLRVVLERARRYGNCVRIDMEESATVGTTLALYRQLRDDYGYGRHVGVVLQAYLYRTIADMASLIEDGAWIRLCKGAYAEPPDVAYADKADTDRNFVQLMQMALGAEARERGVYLGIATHDQRMIQATIDFARAQNIPPERFEFQMLYGIRRELQKSLVAQGFRLRLYIPYGTAWYPYFMRRLAERPANLWFFVSNLVRG